ncbi:hypothetical protein QVD17_17870 [Tagetes erecta]|uniref:Uncharacterized protein n=1 Tax=Tagetes erecta TaxID=13708 RepID=A0AAD8KGQ9_TARER|nr:hypothetical protein QVD17_17870 [Tagetes erecta]
MFKSHRSSDYSKGKEVMKIHANKAIKKSEMHDIRYIFGRLHITSYEEAEQGIEAWIVRILHDVGNNLIITLDEDIKPEDEDDPSDDYSLVDTNEA